MAVIVTKDKDDNVELTKKINADLRAKMSQAQNTEDNPLDSIESSEYLEDQQKTGRFTWIWFVLIILALISLVYITLL